MVLTVGEAALKAQTNDVSTDFVEMQREIHKGSNSNKSYEEEVHDCIQRALNDSSISGDFFVVVLVKKERLLKNVVRQYFFYRQSCPTPEFDQTVYKYHREPKRIEYLWTVPDNSTCQWLPLRVNDLPDDQKLLVSMIQSFKNGDLDKLCKKLNAEV